MDNTGLIAVYFNSWGRLNWKTGWLLAGGVAGVCSANPVVIANQGPTFDLSRYAATATLPKPLTLPTKKLSDLQLSLFPVNTPELSPGKVSPRRIDAPYLDRPFFLIGADQSSLAWLKTHRQTLIKIRAVGLVVNVPSAAAFKQLRHTGHGLSINPLTASQLVQKWRLRHYPVLITAQSISQ